MSDKDIIVQHVAVPAARLILLFPGLGHGVDARMAARVKALAAT